MKFKNNKKYHIWEDYYVFCKNGMCYLMSREEYIFPNAFKTIRLLYRYEYPYKSESHGDVVLLMIYKTGLAGIFDLQNLKWIKEEFKYSNFRLVHKNEDIEFEKQKPYVPIFCENDFMKNIPSRDFVERKKVEHIYEIITKNPYRLINYSLERGVLLDLNKEPEFCEFGYIIDDHIIYEFSGYQIDLNTLELITDETIYPVYYDKVNDNYFVLVDEENAGMMVLEEEGDVLTCYYEGSRYSPAFKIIFNKDTEEMETEKPRNSGFEWTQEELRDAADIAYEGYSRTELGLD